LLHVSPLYLLLILIHTLHTDISILSLHYALPIYEIDPHALVFWETQTLIVPVRVGFWTGVTRADNINKTGIFEGTEGSSFGFRRSEEHTSELQSRFDLVCRLLLEKKKK